MKDCPPLEDVIRPTTLIVPRRLEQALGLKLVLASETFQHTGSFKFRAAYQLARSVPNHEILVASSGNFGLGLAYACALLNKTARIVMPDNSSRVKVDAIRHLGAHIDFINVNQISRHDRVEALSRERPEAFVASAYDHPEVIAGNASLGRELAAPGLDWDVLLAPIGGGGLSSGLVSGLAQAGRKGDVYAVEPVVANDAAQSFRAGRIIGLDHEPDTIADGVRCVRIGTHNWSILKTGLAGVIEVEESHIRQAVARLFLDANLKAEPTGALAFAALLSKPERFRGHSVCCVVSGGNVDPDLYRTLI